MSTLEVVIYVLYGLITIAAPIFVTKLKRKYSVICFTAAYYMGVAFSFLIYLSILTANLQALTETIASLTIGWLTLALVWSELDKRPELGLLNFIPVAYNPGGKVSESYQCPANREPGQISKKSRFWKIREASFSDPDLKFDKSFSFSFDLSNIGYEEIVPNNYVVFVDGKTIREGEFGDVVLRAHQKRELSTGLLAIQTAGFHEVSIEVYTALTKVSLGIWFFVSNDYKKLKYVKAYLPKFLWRPLIKFLLDP